MSEEIAMTPRQREVLELVGQGLSYKKAGARLGIKGNTVRVYVQQILAKLPEDVRHLRPRDAIVQFYRRQAA